MNKCRCLITDDHPIVRRGVRELLEEEQLCSEISEVRTGEEALEAVRRHPGI
jgi:two-component system invasion response regulator UvrY